MPVLDPQALIDNRVEAIREFHESINQPKAEIDVSGGVDSAVLVCLLALALGPENVIAVHSGINTDPDQTARAREVCAVAGVKLIEADLTEVYDKLLVSMQTAILDAYGADEPTILPRLHEEALADPTILGSLRSCLRAPIGRGFNRIMGGGIRHGTGNECEDRWARFFQKGGDGEVDTNPIAMLSKAEVYQLALKLGVPKSIITATPSPDLWGEGDVHNDEDEFANYFGFKASDYGQTFYGYIDPETGEQVKVGLIERVSRFLDLTTTINVGFDFSEDWTYEKLLFGDYTDDRLAFVFEEALEAAPFAGIDPECVEKVLKATRRIERMTRHKLNPACPTLGERSDLLEYEILTDTLPGSLLVGMSYADGHDRFEITKIEGGEYTVESPHLATEVLTEATLRSRFPGSWEV
jgi:NAD+ synthetase